MTPLTIPPAIAAMWAGTWFESGVALSMPVGGVVVDDRDEFGPVGGSAMLGVL